MEHVARTLHVDELTAERCVACGARADEHVALVTPEGVPDPAERGVTRAHVCRRCWTEQKVATLPDTSRLMRTLAVTPPVVGLVTSLIVRSAGGAATVGVVIALIVTHAVRALLRRRRVWRAPVLLLGAKGEQVTLQLLVREARVVTEGSYRSPASGVDVDDAKVVPFPARTKWMPLWTAGIVASVLVVTLAWGGAFER